MNWNLIGWFAGVLVTFGVLKFIWAFFRALTGKEARDRMIEGVSEKITGGAEEMSNFIKKKAAERKQRKEDENRPIITIR